MKLAAFISIIFVLLFAGQASAQKDKWRIADETILRLKPAAFSHLPANIVSFLEKRGCTVPQIFGNSQPHNVIRGQFAKTGQFDWAVLCSKNRISSILVFWNASTKSVAEIASSEDKTFLQTTNEAGNIGFSRKIAVVDKNYLLEHYRKSGKVKSPQIKHQGIGDAFVDKASSVHFFYRQRWLELNGAD